MTEAGRVVTELLPDLGNPRPIRSAFTLFRVGSLGLLTAALVASREVSPDTGSAFEPALWLTICLAYGVCLLATWFIARHRRWQLQWLPTAFDVIFAGTVVQLSGGADSPFTLLYILAILGTLATSDRRLCWTAYGAALAIYLTMSAMQAFNVITATTLAGENVEFTAYALSIAVVGNVAAMSAVCFLGTTLLSQSERTQNQVVELKALYGEILYSLGSGVVTLDTEHRIIYANPVATSMLNDAANSVDLDRALIGRSLEDLIPGSCEHICGTAISQRVELVVGGESGRPRRELSLQSSMLSDRRGKRIGHVLHVDELTELRRLEREVRRNERLAVIGQLSATVAHEVRNPLAAISGCAELLSAGNRTAQEERLVAIIRRETDRLESTVRQLLHFTRERPTRTESIEVVARIHEIVEAFKISVKSEALRVEINGDAEAWTLVDRDQFAQVMWNLLRNASDAMSGNGCIEIEVHGINDKTVLSFRDNGPGIAKEHADRIFEPFFTTKRDGSGFGLAVVGQLVAAQGGKIEFFPRSEGGAEFRLTWPQGGTHEAEPETHVERPARERLKS
jgi:two-component system sensor histidine kinase PilS (NtrC family)